MAAPTGLRSIVSINEIAHLRWPDITMNDDLNGTDLIAFLTHRLHSGMRRIAAPLACLRLIRGTEPVAAGSRFYQGVRVRGAALVG